VLKDVQGQCKREKRWDERNMFHSALYISSYRKSKDISLSSCSQIFGGFLGGYFLGLFLGGSVGRMGVCIYLIPPGPQRFQLIGKQEEMG